MNFYLSAMTKALIGIDYCITCILMLFFIELSKLYIAIICTFYSIGCISCGLYFSINAHFFVRERERERKRVVLMDIPFVIDMYL